MLNEEELVLALINNLSTWDWEVFSKFPIDEDTGKALVKEFWKSRSKE